MSPRNQEDVQHIIVRRKHLLKDAMKAFSKPKFEVSKYLRVRFIGESAQDEGGPRREFFRLLMPLIGQSQLFTGWPENVVPVHNVISLSLNEYYLVGKMLTTSVIQGGQPPVFFAAAVVDFILDGHISSQFNVNDIPCSETDAREFIANVSY